MHICHSSTAARSRLCIPHIHSAWRSRPKTPILARPRHITCAAAKAPQPGDTASTNQQPTQAQQQQQGQQVQAQQQQSAGAPVERERDLVIPIAVAISLAGYALIALIGLLDSYRGCGVPQPLRQLLLDTVCRGVGCPGLPGLCE